jgi:hypothetical protein
MAQDFFQLINMPAVDCKQAGVGLAKIMNSQMPKLGFFANPLVHLTKG